MSVLIEEIKLPVGPLDHKTGLFHSSQQPSAVTHGGRRELHVISFVKSKERFNVIKINMRTQIHTHTSQTEGRCIRNERLYKSINTKTFQRKLAKRNKKS